MKCPRCFFADPHITDETCRRCSRNFTRIELAEVLAIGLLYLFVCRFSHYLFTGDFFSHPLSGGFFPPVSFSEIFTFPVNLSEEPWHVLTLGWTFALVVLTPAAVGLFYGAVPGMVVALVCGWHVPVPFFFVTLMLGALAAGTRAGRTLPARLAFFAGLLPATLYLAALSLPVLREQSEAAALKPWVVAAALSAASAWAALWLARRRDYHVTFLLWAVGLQAAAVLAVLHVSVGLGRVEYEFVRREHGPGTGGFRILVAPAGGGRTQEQQRDAARELFQERRRQAIDEFSRFIAWFPRSDETALALLERADLHDLRPYFTGGRPDMLRTYRGRITEESLKDCRAVREKFAESPVVVEARLAVARYCLEHSRLDEAAVELSNLIDFCDVKLHELNPSHGGAPSTPDRGARTSASDGPSTPLRAVSLSNGSMLMTGMRGSPPHLRLLRSVLLRARLDLRVLEQNSDYNRIPLMLFYQLDAHQDDYDAELAKILKWFPDSRLADNIKLIRLQRRGFGMDELEGLLKEHPAGDAAPGMLLLLGTGCRDRRDMPRAESFLKRLLAEFPDSPEAAEATVVLQTLTERSEPDLKTDLPETNIR
jgi:hypothetical protein